MKYNWSIIGHERQLERIEKDLQSGNISHAYLLAGPNSVGKHTVARKFAGILQCENDFCHQCAICKQVAKGGHVDTVEWEDHGGSIKVQEVRKMIERLNMTRQGRYKVFLVQSVERMTPEAANAFLKILEEPPERTVFLLTTDDLSALLPTIVSRVRVVKFKSVAAGYLRGKLRELYPAAEERVLERVSLFSLGKTGKALHLMESPEDLALYMEIYHDVQDFLRHRSVVERFAYVEALLAEPEKLQVFFDILLHVLRSKVLNGEEHSEQLADKVSEIVESSLLLKKNVNSRLVLENLMLSL